MNAALSCHPERSAPCAFRIDAIRRLESQFAAQRSSAGTRRRTHRKARRVLQASSELADRELCLVNLRVSLAAFDRYLRKIEMLYAELDERNAKIAAQFAEQEEIENARAAASAVAAQAGESRPAIENATKVKDFQPSGNAEKFIS